MATESILKEVKITNKLQANKFIEAISKSAKVAKMSNNQDTKYTKPHKHIRDKEEIRTVFGSLFEK